MITSLKRENRPRKKKVLLYFKGKNVVIDDFADRKISCHNSCIQMKRYILGSNRGIRLKNSQVDNGASGTVFEYI
jgi:hypothetical protein